MTAEEAKKFMLIEKECIIRNCNRDCAKCDIVQDINNLNSAFDINNLNSAYELAINALEKHIQNKVGQHVYERAYQEGYEKGYSDGNFIGYHKGVDDFIDACKEDILCQTFGLRQNDIEMIAKQLKEGKNK